MTGRQNDAPVTSGLLLFYSVVAVSVRDGYRGGIGTKLVPVPHLTVSNDGYALLGVKVCGILLPCVLKS